METRNKMKKKQVVRLNEALLTKMVTDAVKRLMCEAESEGWVVETEQAMEAYNLAVSVLGEEEINRAIVRCLGTRTLAECLAYVFRMYDFREWNEHLEGK